MQTKIKLRRERKNLKKSIQQLILSILVGSLVMGNGSIGVRASETEKEKLPSGISYEDIGKEIEQFVEEHKDTTAGVEIAVFDRNQVIYKNSFGYADVENQIPMDETTALDWGSVTKLTVWVSVMQLWEQGKIDFNEDIRTYLPENFLTNLKYDTPITMMHLMNHNAGFQEIMVDVAQKDFKNVVSLEEQLKRRQPEQVYEPGTITAYSNWGTALAGYIVERISGQSYKDYVKEHIFQKLGMEHTALAPDLSDNLWVQEKRKELKCYYPDMEPLGTCFHHLTLYPAGGCVGTLDDLLTFTQAFLPTEGEKSPLFEEEETLQEFLTPTSYFAGTDVVLNSHGFLGEQLGIEVLYHGGNATGSSSKVIIGPETGIGMIILINQKEEQIYNNHLPELVFGKYSDSELAKEEQYVEFGVYRDARTVLNGPTSLTNMRGVYITDGNGIQEYHVASKIGNTEKFTARGGDYVRLSPKEYIPMFTITIGWIFGIVYSIITLLVGGCIITPVSLSVKKKKGIELPSMVARKWNYISCGSMLLLVLSIVRVADCLMWNAAGKTYLWQFALTGVLGVVMAVLLVILFLRWKTWEMTKAEKVKMIITGGFLFFTIAAIWYWDMYVFWQV